ncbi:uncharacterized protein EAF01_004894 [Botrytis porri]|uniref:uncharacterized protein n=1 Tax=Botrytis porri TaxID=87229 RepID=UPI00190074F3|nr:uncharacterized protein EAF01_004894 [Botrytis porri]KAF7907307.1 hypothetical protein EAF01_004894 [Botrytis porri]
MSPNPFTENEITEANVSDLAMRKETHQAEDTRITEALYVLLRRNNTSNSTGFRNQVARFDLAGSFTFMSATISLLLALSWGGTTYAWRSSGIAALLTLAGVLFCLTQLTSATPSTFRAVNTPLTVPLLGLTSTATPFTAGILNISTKAIIALYGLALIGSGATIILSAIYMFKFTARIVYCALFFSFLASNFAMTVTLNLTAVTSMVNQMVSLVGPALGIEASLAEIRAYGFRRRIRTDVEIGDWKGIMNELKRNWKKPVPDGLPTTESDENLMLIERVDEVTSVATKEQSYRLR